MAVLLNVLISRAAVIQDKKEFLTTCSMYWSTITTLDNKVIH